MRRLVGALVATFALGVLISPAGADDHIPSGSTWGGSTVTPPDPVTGSVSDITIAGRIQNNSDLLYTPPTVTVSFSNDVSTGCKTPPAGPAKAATVAGPTSDSDLTRKRYTYTADVPFSPNRNGDYQVYVCFNGLRRLDTQVEVRLPAPTVTNLVATSAGHDVSLTWDDVRVLAPDLSGYRIERSVGGGAFESLQTVGPEASTFTDTTLPEAGGEATYQVIALRPQVSDGTASNTSATSFDPAPTDPTAPGGGTGGAGGTGGTGTGGSGGSTSPGGPGRTGGSGSPVVTGGPTIRIPRVGTPSRNFFPALLAPPALDTGFSEELPYDESASGQDELAGEDAASDAPAALPGRGLVIPLATGLVLAVWALHLRFLARALRPEYAEAIDFLS